ncbi:hypothetical protein BCR39DRAFT_541265 [Naematelia encephala]|uniref:Alpha/beta hydrolase fold-3 domain-containing protein n=1 Tax=Naematelia encephala TaxID=71784 RepID=A0A1Y2AV38_9TREE|nr:hypothetical protein BCR39DRAFT_541265 [Naematelia encephala]
MPDFLTPQALATAGPLLLETFIKHYLVAREKGDGDAKDDLMYDEAFTLVKTFLEIATKHPVSNLQRFGLVRTPAPPPVALHRVVIPQVTLVQAADYIVTAFGGPEMAYKVAGGTKWWQVRAGPGVEAEWIVMKKDWRAEGVRQTKMSKGKEPHGMVGDDGGVGENGEFRREMDELRCMLYIHGGAYYWGSINTHRYTIWRYARKMHGRCFAVNYRKAPQYPFPCAIQDCLAAWLYLVDPPPEAKHKPVHPKNIILAGDSAGGGLVWALLQILRDTEGLELPAGAVLISPWSDLTHSFPSILHNTATDIVPPYSFIHKPSSLWPPPPPALTDEMQDRLRSRVKEAVARLRNDHHTAEAAHHRASVHSDREAAASPIREIQDLPDKLRTSSPGVGAPKSGGANESDLHPITEKNETGAHPLPKEEPHHNPSRANPALLYDYLSPKSEAKSGRPTTLAQCNIPLKLKVEDEDVAINTQIQLYATNAQLCHPWVSPVLGYLGGLPPLLITCGDNEVLRDEIIFAAHKAANPGKYPIRDDVRKMLPSLEGIEEKHGPTDVHLQVYDGVCHDLPLFSMTKPARGIFRSIASFARYVTPSAPGSLSISRPVSPSGSTSDLSPSITSDANSRPILEGDATSTPPFITPSQSTADLPSVSTSSVALAAPVFTDEPVVDSPTSLTFTKDKSRKARFESLPASGGHLDKNKARRYDSMPVSGDDAGPRFEDPANKDSRAAPGTAGHSGIYRGPHPFTDHMIRERVATDGVCRPLEPPSELSAMTMPFDEIGVIKEGPAIRYLNGQALWDKKFKHARKAVAKHRKKNLETARTRDSSKIAGMWKEKMEKHDAERRVKKLDTARTTGPDDGWESSSDNDDDTSHRILDQSWSWSWAQDGEAPPPSAIVSRRDFGEARNLALMADRMDSTHGTPIHGLSIWVGLASFFSNTSERSKAVEALKQARKVNRANKATDDSHASVKVGAGKRAVKGHKEGVMKRIFGMGKNSKVKAEE